jgi:TolB-like protein
MKTNQHNRGFLRELKRRRVLHTASLYVVGAWIALQVVEVLSGAGLPPSTMRNLLVLLSIGFPVALVFGWFFDISKEGIVKTGPLKEGEQLPTLKFFDHILMTGLLLVVAMDAYILSFPPPEEALPVSTNVSQQRTIAVLGFEDIELAEGSDPIGDVFAGELRSSLTRTAGLRVLGPETSKMLQQAGDTRLATAKELLVTAIVLGEVLLEGGRLKVNTSLIGVPAGNELWSSSVEAPVGDAIEIQQGLLKQLIGAIAPKLDPDPIQGPRAEAGVCSAVYDIYLRGKQLSKARQKTQADQYNRGMELLRQAVETDDQCAIAWETIAVASVDYARTMPGYVKASAAARRALELNDTLPEAWTVLAEIAEEEQRWNDSEEYFLRALYADPTNIHANLMYSEALIARGRVTDALHYSLEAYRYEPASVNVNWRVSMAAGYAGDGDLVIKHIEIAGEIAGGLAPFHTDLLAGGYLLNGETVRALEVYAEKGEKLTDWFLDCIRVRDEPGLAPGVSEAMWDTLELYKSGQLTLKQEWNWGPQIMGCGSWLGEPDVVFELLFAKSKVFKGDTPTEVIFINMFVPDGGVLRKDPRFRELVVESGLLDYWRKWGWADYCEADGDSFRCD